MARSRADNLTRTVQTLVTSRAGDELDRRASAAGVKLSSYVRRIIMIHLGLIKPRNED